MLIRINKMICKSEIFELMEDSKIARIQYNYRKNKDLNDKSVCKISLYINARRNLHNLFLTIEEVYCGIVNDENAKILKSIIGRKSVGWIKPVDIYRLKKIELAESVDFKLGDDVIELIEKYK